MIPHANLTHLSSDIQEGLLSFWKESLSIEPFREGISIAMPLMLPDGLQVVIHLDPLSESTAILSDKGETLGRLFGEGLNVESGLASQLLGQKLALFELQREGFELRKVIKLPVQAIDIQLFSEAVVSISHLIYRNEPEAEEKNVLEGTLGKLFEEVKVTPKRNYSIAGKVEKSIRLSYFVEGENGLGIQVVSRRNNLRDYMEQWGFRWGDIRQEHPNLVQAMIYDPDRQDWDETSMEIGRAVCDYFCPYHDFPSIREAIARS